jgi:hypothetical protein
LSKKPSEKRIKGQGSVFTDPRFPYLQISYWNGWRQVRKSSGTTDHAEAIKILQRKLGEIAVTKPAGAEQIRIGALLQMVIDDYRRNDQADLRETEQRVNGRVTKNRAAKTAPIYGDMEPWLELLLSRGQEDSPKCIWLFSRAGKPIKSFRADSEKACEAACVPGLLFHDLRRTVVRNMIRTGVPEKLAMQISGHKTASMLWRYNITDTRDIKEPGKRTGSYLKSERKDQHAEKPTDYFGTKAS